LGQATRIASTQDSPREGQGASPEATGQTSNVMQFPLEALAAPAHLTRHNKPHRDWAAVTNNLLRSIDPMIQRNGQFRQSARDTLSRVVSQWHAECSDFLEACQAITNNKGASLGGDRFHFVAKGEAPAIDYKDGVFGADVFEARFGDDDAPVSHRFGLRVEFNGEVQKRVWTGAATKLNGEALDHPLAWRRGFVEWLHTMALCYPPH
jgi:hypothetical protein